MKWTRRLDTWLQKELDAQYFLGQDTAPERVNTRHMFLVFALLAVFMALFHALSSRWGELLLWVGFGLFYALLSWLTRKNGQTRLLLYVGMVAFSFFSFYLLLFGSSSLVGILWLLLIPFILCFFQEFDFSLSFLTLLAAAQLFLLSPLFDVWRSHQWPAAFLNGFPLAFVIAALVAIALRYRRDVLYKTLRVQFRALLEGQHRDPLTQFFSRRVFPEFFEREIAYNRRYQNGLQLMLIDISNFHIFNELLGYGEGDQCLKAMSQLLKRQLRATDYCFRWDGDVFLLLLPQTSPLGAANLSDRLQRLIKETPYTCKSGRVVEVSCCVGTAPYNDNLTSDENLDLLSGALETDKRKRNQA